MPMEQSVMRTVGPTEEPVTLAQAKDHLELLASNSHHDAKLELFLQAAREKVEKDSGQILVTQTFVASRHEFPESLGWIELPFKPLIAVSGITYYDSDNSQQPLSTSVYGVDTRERLVYLKYDQTWPSITQQHNGIEVTFTAGYGTAAQVPAIFKELILLQVARMFYDRGDNDTRRWQDAYECMLPTVMRESYP